MTGSGPAAVDVAVIGGGIQGAGIAQAAAAAGYSVTLIEKSEPGAGTSSKSSKLIHGGLRYLQQGQFRLVREALRERRILCNIAPHLVHLSQFHIPVYRHSWYRPWQIRTALVAYSLLAGYSGEARFHSVPRSRWQQLAGLETRDLEAVFCYSDGQTDDEQLTRAVMQSAISLDATLYSNTELLAASRVENGYQLLLGGGGEQTLHCRVLVNAAGPWINTVASRVDPGPPVLAVSLVQGSHLVLDKPLSAHCFYLESPDDHRGVFAVPWRGKTLLGTTEKAFSGDPDHVEASGEEEAYLLRTLARYFPGYVEAGIQVSGRMAGLRVLPDTRQSPFSRSREVRLASCFEGGAGYIAVYGGKLTGYRANARKVLGIVRKHLGAREQQADTATLPLP